MSRPSRLSRGPILFAAALLLWILSLWGPWALTGITRWSAGILYVAYDTWLIVYVALALRASRSDGDTTSAAVLNKSKPSVAVILSARDEVLALPATLDALLAQQEPVEEIWLIDDGSTDDTLALLSQRYGVDVAAGCGRARSSLYPCLQVISKPTSGKADSLNLGIGSSSGELVITVDADTVLRFDAVGAMRRAFSEDPQLVAAGGVLTPRCAAGFSGRIF